MVPALLFAGPLFGIAFAQSEVNGTLIAPIQDLLEPQQTGQTLPMVQLSEGLLLADPAIEIPPSPMTQQNQQTDIPEALPIGDQVNSNTTHAPAALQQSIPDTLTFVDTIEPKVVKSIVAHTTPLNDGIGIVDSLFHTAANKKMVNLGDTLGIGAITAWTRPITHQTTNPPPSVPPTQPNNPSPNPTGNPVPQKASHLTRSILDAITMDDISAGHGPSGVATYEELRVIDNIAVSGLVVPASAPKISVTAPPILQVTPDQSAEMTFHSTTSGTYSISIKSDDGGHVVRTIDGKMSLGANSATWDGKDGQGNIVTAGSYSYYIRAQSLGGVREPPAEGDGAIVVVGAPKPPGQVPLPTDMSYWLILPIVAAAGIASFLFLRRKRPLTFYLPDEASPVIDDIRSRYPDAAVEDYVETTEEGVRRFKGVTIRSGKADDEWMEEIAGRVKKLAGVDSLNVNYKGKTMTL